VPTFTCGLVRSNFFFAISLLPLYFFAIVSRRFFGTSA